jgi:hypothetical protein
VTRLLRQPAVHFVVLGAALYAAQAWWTPPVPATPVPDDELLYRAALASGLDQRDPLVRERLEKLGRFVAADGVVGEPERTARDLGLVGTDAVIRRHLVHAMRLALSAPGAGERATDADVDAWLAAHPDRFAAPPTTSLTHVYLARGRHDATAADAVLARLRAGDPATMGDAFLLGSHLDAATDDAIDRTFGPGFAAALRDAPSGQWIGPIASSYGMHLVRIDARQVGTLTPSPAIRRQAAVALVAERRDARLQQRLAALRSN